MRSGCILVCLAVAAGFAAYVVLDRRPHPPAGQMVSGDPVQTSVPAGSPPWFTIGQARVTPLAAYHLRARVLSARTYWFDRESAIAPEDLALGWGSMSDWAIYSRLDIGQSGRFYRYHWGREGPPLPVREIVTHSANNHIIPANDEVRHVLKTIREGDIIRLAGELVEVRDPHGGVWRSSLTREDSGWGACELIYTDKLAVEPP